MNFKGRIFMKTQQLAQLLYPDLETCFAHLCGILVTSAQVGGLAQTGGRVIQMKQRKHSCCVLIKIWS